MKPTFMVLLLGLMVPVPVLSQRILGVGGFFRVGYANLAQTDALTRSVVVPSASPIGNGFGTAGCELFIHYQRAILSINVLGMGKVYRDGTGQTVDLTASTTHLKFGWVVWSTPRYVVYPSIGPGLENLSLSKGQTGSASVQYFSRHSTDVGINADFTLDTRPVGDGSYGRVLLGVRLGCFINWKQNRWQNDLGEYFPRSSAWRPSGLYATLTVGSESFVKK